MGFTFGFTEDIEDENLATVVQSNIEKKEFINPIDQVNDIKVPSKAHSLNELLESSCKDIRFTFEPVPLNNGMVIFRRELFDVRHQLMMEDKNLKNNSDVEEFNILIGETDEDLKNGVYEGGLKSWECSFDVINKLIDSSEIENQLVNANDNINIIELGCGTALPTLYILKLLFEYKKDKNNANRPVKVVLSDFNYDVLRLVTLPNILINWCFSVLTEEEFIELQKREDIDGDGNVRDEEIDSTVSLITKFKSWLAESNIDICFISGSWCRDFMTIVHSYLPNMANEFNVVLTSETIYSPAILPVISEIMVELTHSKGVSILSAKDIYFGVGGSVVECLQYLSRRNVAVTTTAVPGNLQRSLIELHRAV